MDAYNHSSSYREEFLKSFQNKTSRPAAAAGGGGGTIPVKIESAKTVEEESRHHRRRKHRHRRRHSKDEDDDFSNDDDDMMMPPASRSHDIDPKIVSAAALAAIEMYQKMPPRPDTKRQRQTQYGLIEPASQAAAAAAATASSRNSVPVIASNVMRTGGGNLIPSSLPLSSSSSSYPTLSTMTESDESASAWVSIGNEAFAYLRECALSRIHKSGSGDASSTTASRMHPLPALNTMIETLSKPDPTGGAQHSLKMLEHEYMSANSTAVATYKEFLETAKKLEQTYLGAGRNRAADLNMGLALHSVAEAMKSQSILHVNLANTRGCWVADTRETVLSAINELNQKLSDIVMRSTVLKIDNVNTVSRAYLAMLEKHFEQVSRVSGGGSGGSDGMMKQLAYTYVAYLGKVAAQTASVLPDLSRRVAASANVLASLPEIKKVAAAAFIAADIQNLLDNQEHLRSGGASGAMMYEYSLLKKEYEAAQAEYQTAAAAAATASEQLIAGWSTYMTVDSLEALYTRMTQAYARKAEAADRVDASRNRLIEKVDNDDSGGGGGSGGEKDLGTSLGFLKSAREYHFVTFYKPLVRDAAGGNFADQMQSNAVEYLRGVIVSKRDRAIDELVVEGIQRVESVYVQMQDWLTRKLGSFKVLRDSMFKQLATWRAGLNTALVEKKKALIVTGFDMRSEKYLKLEKTLEAYTTILMPKATMAYQRIENFRCAWDLRVALSSTVYCAQVACKK